MTDFTRIDHTDELAMHIISKHPQLSAFWSEHHDAKVPLLAWYQFVSHADWRTFAELRRDYVGNFVVFDIGGNKYRLAVRVSFNKGKVYVHRVMTHREYDRGDWKKE